jgi:hypothetical protein
VTTLCRTEETSNAPGKLHASCEQSPEIRTKMSSKAGARTLCLAEWGSTVPGWPLGWAGAGGPVRQGVGSPAPAAAGRSGAALAAAGGDPAGLRSPETRKVRLLS